MVLFSQFNVGMQSNWLHFHSHLSGKQQQLASAFLNIIGYWIWVFTSLKIRDFKSSSVSPFKLSCHWSSSFCKLFSPVLTFLQKREKRRGKNIVLLYSLVISLFFKKFLFSFFFLMRHQSFFLAIFPSHHVQ